MTKSQRGVKFARIEKLFPHEQPTPHQRDDVTELGNHRQVTENQPADDVSVSHMAAFGVHRQSGEDFADRPVIEATFPAIASVVVDLQSFVAQRLLAEQQISGPDVSWRCRITPNVFRVRLQRLLGY